MNIDKNELRKKLDLVIDKLLNLGGPENEEELSQGEKRSVFSSVISALRSGTGRRA